MGWEVIYYQAADGEYPVQKLLDELPKPHRAKVFAALSLLQERGPTLGFPHTSQVEGRIRELRTHYGRHLYRILYFMDNQRRVVLLEAFEKDTPKVPPDRLRTARNRLQDHVAREE